MRLILNGYGINGFLLSIKISMALNSLRRFGLSESLEKILTASLVKMSLRE